MSSEDDPEDEEADREDLIDELKKLSPSERQQLLEEAGNDDQIPIIRWSSNPVAVKSALNFINEKGTVTYEELREHLYNKDLIDAEKGKYNFGIVSVEENDPLFNTTGDQEANTEISLTQTGTEIAEVFDGNSELRAVERALLLGLQPYGTAFKYLSVLDDHRDEGILREDFEEKLVDQYEGSGSYFLGYYNSWFSKLGLIEKERVGRKVKYRPTYPNQW